MAQNGRDGFHVHPVLQGQSGEGVAQVMEPHIGQPRPFQHPAEHIPHAVWANRPAVGRREHILAVGFLLLALQHSQGLFSQGDHPVGVLGFQRGLHHLPVDSGNLPPHGEGSTGIIPLVPAHLSVFMRTGLNLCPLAA